MIAVRLLPRRTNRPDTFDDRGSFGLDRMPTVRAGTGRLHSGLLRRNRPARHKPPDLPNIGPHLDHTRSPEDRSLPNRKLEYHLEHKIPLRSHSHRSSRWDSLEGAHSKACRCESLPRNWCPLDTHAHLHTDSCKHNTGAHSTGHRGNPYPHCTLRNERCNETDGR